MSRTLSPAFVQDLKDGVLSSLLQTVRDDDTLMLCTRGTYLNIYYRGGSILRLAEGNVAGHYRAFFDKKYEKDSSREVKRGPDDVASTDAAQAWVDAFNDLKGVMNRFFAKHPKSEREFQQLVAWENNRSALANETEYFVTDIEFADSELGARIDMLALKWLSSDKKDARLCRPVLIEMKYGDSAIAGGADLEKHLKDLNALLNDQKRRENLSRMIVDQFNQLSDLGLLKYNKSSRIPENGIAYFDTDRRPEVVFLLANHNPRSKALSNALKEIEVSGLLQAASHFDLRFFVSTFAGYAMHEASMVEFAKFKDVLDRLRP